MLTIAKPSAGGESYSLSTVASGVEDYYVGTGEVAGYWAGTAAADLGAAGDVTSETLRAVLAGTDAGGGRLVGLRGNRKVPGWDATVAAPKSVSLLWALGEPDVANSVREAHDVAVAAALGYLEEHAAFCRRGTNGVERVQADGLAAAAFRHRSSRNRDPHLHTHVLITNQARAVDDGRWRTLESARLYAAQYRSSSSRARVMASSKASAPILNCSALVMARCCHRHIRFAKRQNVWSPKTT